MAVTDVNVIDGIAFDDDNKTLIMEIYDHLHFEGKFEFDHFVINIHFRYEITENCKKYINVSNQKLSVLNIKIVSYLNTFDTE